MTTTIAQVPDPCGCHGSLAAHQVSELAPATISYVGESYNVMEFGTMHIHVNDSPPVEFYLFMIVVLMIISIRSCREEPYIAFGSIVSGIGYKRALFRPEKRFLIVRRFISPVHLQELRSQIRCAYCRDLIDGSIQPQRCPYCRTMHHSECFRDAGCAIFGCRFNVSRPMSAGA